jgi:hypothetical protein
MCTPIMLIDLVALTKPGKIKNTVSAVLWRFATHQQIYQLLPATRIQYGTSYTINRL